MAMGRGDVRIIEQLHHREGWELGRIAAMVGLDEETVESRGFGGVTSVGVRASLLASCWIFAIPKTCKETR